MRRYQSWAIIDHDDGSPPLRKPLRKHLTRHGAERQANSSCYDAGLQLALLMVRVHQGIKIAVRPEVTEA